MKSNCIITSDLSAVILYTSSASSLIILLISGLISISLHSLHYALVPATYLAMAILMNISLSTVMKPTVMCQHVINNVKYFSSHRSTIARLAGIQPCSNGKKYL